MSHRIVNNVGYYKIYPMSFGEDSTFCHYCGRKAAAYLQLEWDHVPALNVRLPLDAENLRKTLVRSCSECNRLASDVPHTDYIERHFWLKAAYLRRYKRILLNDDIFRDDSETDGFLKAYVSNAKIKYYDLLRGIGFGIKSIDEIESPILKLKTKSNRVLLDVIHCYLYYPLTDEDEDEQIEIIDTPELELQSELEECCSIDEFIEFLYLESPIHQELLTLDGYHSWGVNNESRCALLDLPIDPEKSYNDTWDKIVEKVYQQYIDTGIDDQFCAFSKFVSHLKSDNYRNITSISEYQDWHHHNIKTLFMYSLPKDPCSFYNKSLEEINTVLGKGIRERSYSFSEFTDHLRNDCYYRIDSIEEYLDWHTSSIDYLGISSSPKDPCSFYGKSLEEINEAIDGRFTGKFCPFSKFISYLKETDYRHIESPSEYQDWYKVNKDILLLYTLPKDPFSYFSKSLEEINEALNF